MMMELILLKPEQDLKLRDLLMVMLISLLQLIGLGQQSLLLLREGADHAGLSLLTQFSKELDTFTNPNKTHLYQELSILISFQSLALVLGEHHTGLMDVMEEL